MVIGDLHINQKVNLSIYITSEITTSVVVSISVINGALNLFYFFYTHIMAEKLTKIVVRIAGWHPTWSRNRAGYKFGNKPSEVEVTNKELEMIKSDKYLLIVTAWNWLNQAKWVKAEKLKTAWKKTESKKDEGWDDKKEDIFKKDIIVELEKFEVEFKKNSNRDVLHELLVETVVEKLIEKEMKEGEDFTRESDVRDLIVLLETE